VNNLFVKQIGYLLKEGQLVNDQMSNPIATNEQKKTAKKSDGPRVANQPAVKLNP